MPLINGENPEQTKVPTAADELDETELLQDLEIKNPDQADAVQGGNSGGANPGKVTFNPFQITR
jgi:hypothetical protein